MTAMIYDLENQLTGKDSISIYYCHPLKYIAPYTLGIL